MPPIRDVAVALGSNLGNSFECSSFAALFLKTKSQTGSFRCSPLFKTSPVGGPSNQPDFVNAVLLLRSDIPPEQFLLILQHLEHVCGRERSVSNGPRTLDLDLLWCGRERLNTSSLVLPHPRLHQRRFVLHPLTAIDPALTPPGSSLTVAELLQNVELTGSEPAPVQLPSPHNWPG